MSRISLGSSEWNSRPLHHDDGEGGASNWVRLLHSRRYCMQPIITHLQPLLLRATNNYSYATAAAHVTEALIVDVAPRQAQAHDAIINQHSPSLQFAAAARSGMPCPRPLSCPRPLPPSTALHTQVQPPPPPPAPAPLPSPKHFPTASTLCDAPASDCLRNKPT